MTLLSGPNPSKVLRVSPQAGGPVLSIRQLGFVGMTCKMQCHVSLKGSHLPHPTSLTRIRLEMLERAVADVDVADDVEAALLEGVDEVDQGAARPRVRHQEQHLRGDTTYVTTRGLIQA